MNSYGDLICKICGKREKKFLHTVDVYALCLECEKQEDEKRLSRDFNINIDSCSQSEGDLL